MDRRELQGVLAEGGFLAPDEEADELIAAAAGDPSALDAMVRRRLTGEPLAWITGTVEFCGARIRVDPGVFVPRWHTEPLVARAAELLPPDGIGVDVCTGSGAVARVMAARRPEARVVGTDLDPAAWRAPGRTASRRTPAICSHRSRASCSARRRRHRGRAVRADGRAVAAAAGHVHVRVAAGLRRRTATAATSSAGWSPRARPSCAPAVLCCWRWAAVRTSCCAPDLERAGFTGVRVFTDEEGDVRGIEATLGSGA